MRKVILLSIILLSMIACATIGNYTARKDPMCPTCEKFEDMGYQRVFIVTNYGKLPAGDFMVYAINRASFYKYTRIRFFWSKMLGSQWVLREAVIYYE